ncbi:MAG: ABC transporter permease [Methanobrevibacter sp.]|nr:ABC transporter permease [Candidatus Methanovirga australis]
MSFAKFIFKSSFRKKSRIIYTLTGISIPIFLILFFAISANINDNMYEKVSSDITIPSRSMLEIDDDGRSPIHNLTENLMDEIKKDNRIEKVVGSYHTSWSFNKKESILLNGVNSQDIDFMKIHLSAGRMFDDNKKEIVLSYRDSNRQNKTIGENLLFNNDSYEIVGITTFKGGISSYTSVKNVKEIESMDNLVNIERQGNVNNAHSIQPKNSMQPENIYIKIKKGENASQITKDLKNEFSNESLMVEGPDEKKAIENKHRDRITEIIFNYIPVLIGILLTLIIMLKSVGDRTREIGVLKSIGWKSKRIFLMILIETFILSILSFFIASILVILITFEMNNMRPDYAVSFFMYLDSLSIETFLRAFGIVLIMAVLGSIIPAIKASRLSPTEALKYE